MRPGLAMNDIYTDDDDLVYCEPHRKDYCHTFCCDFRGMNAYTRGELTDANDIVGYGEDTFVEAARALFESQLLKIR